MTHELMTSQQKQQEIVAEYEVVPVEDIEGRTLTVEDGDDVLEATEVTLVPSKTNKKKRIQSKILLYSLTIVVVLVIAAIVAVCVVLRPPPTTESPSLYPTLEPTAPPTKRLYSEYIDFLSNVSEKKLLTTTDTPQYKALQWIYHYDIAGRRPLSNPRLYQRYIAAVFYFSTSLAEEEWSDCFEGDMLCTGNSKHPWLGEEDECDWYGFEECDEYDFVKRFVFLDNQNDQGEVISGANLHGTLPSELGYLENLTELSIARNPMLKSIIPSTFSKLTNLISWNFYSNGLTGPLHEKLFENMTNLKELYFGYNNFSDVHLPISLMNAKSLVRLDLAGNAFQGSIPTEYGQLQQLEMLALNENYLKGSIPYSFGKLSSLQILKLNNNELTGSISEELFANMSHLKRLDLSQNQFNGSIPVILRQIPCLHTHSQNTSHSGNKPEAICNKTHLNCKIDCELVKCDCCYSTCDDELSP